MAFLGFQINIGRHPWRSLVLSKSLYHWMGLWISSIWEEHRYLRPGFRVMGHRFLSCIPEGLFSRRNELSSRGLLYNYSFPS